VSGTADQNLLAAVKNFEALGGRGGWFKSVSPFDQARGDYYLVRSLPLNVEPTANVLALRLDHDKEQLQSMLDAGVPVVFGAIPLETQVLAAALGDVQLATDAIAAGRIQNTKYIVLLQPTAGKYVLSHEYQHWKDYGDKEFEGNVGAAMKPFLEASYLAPEDKQFIWRVIWEIRGHAVQRLAALADADAKLPYLNGVGDVITDPGQVANAYGFEEAEATSAFMEAYQLTLLHLLAKIGDNDGGKEAFVAAASKFDFSDNPKNTLTFGSIPGVQ
jgi:hypothetical protein